MAAENITIRPSDWFSLLVAQPENHVLPILTKRMALLNT
jgi:hypothetical protein